MSLEPSGFNCYSTSLLSDALDKLGLKGSALNIAPLAGGQRMIGRAFTVRYVASGNPPGTVGDYIDDVQAGEVAVLDNAGRTDCTVWGDILTAVAHSRRIAGTVINGVCRDTSRIISLEYPVYSLGKFMRTGKDRVEVAEIGGVVSLGDVQVQAGDLIIGDDDGIVVIASRNEEAVLKAASVIAKQEETILAEALKLGSLRDARAQFGYHLLQRNQDES